ncbi:MAG: tetratricopeptide repeat protein, partial [Candidatus Poseidoniales archaeon]
LAWGYPVGIAGDVDQFIPQVREGGGNWVSLDTLSGTAQTTVHEGAALDVTVEYRVLAVGGEGQTATSNLVEVSFEYPDAPEAPVMKRVSVLNKASVELVLATDPLAQEVAIYEFQRWNEVDSTWIPLTPKHPSSLGFPVNHTDQGLNTDELDSLVESGLARQADADTYDVHDLIREFLLRSLTTALREEFHGKCVEWYEKQSPSHELHIELIYHTIKSSQFEAASDLIVREGRQLVSQGYMELLGLIEQIETAELTSDVVVRMAQIQGDILALLGRLSEAEEVLNATLERASSSADELVQAEILSSLADVSRKQGNSDVSLSRHKEALKHYISLGHARWAARTYNNIGYLLRRKNERGKALEAYGEVEAILESSDDDDLIYSQITLARSLIELGEVDRAREHAMASHERTSELGDSVLHARAQAVLGRYYSKVEQSELALFHYSEALTAMTDAGDVQSLVEITMLLGEVLHDAGRTEEAVEHYGQALVLAEANDLRMQIGELLTRLGGVAPDKQGRMEYLQRALKVFRELGAKSRMREVQAMVHRAVMSR